MYKKFCHLICTYRHPISSMVYGTNALFVKPAISLSPMLAVAILNRYGYSYIQHSKNSPVRPTASTPSPDQLKDLKDAMFFLVCWYPIVLGTIQLISWSFFRITNRIEKNHWTFQNQRHFKDLIIFTLYNQSDLAEFS